MGTKVPGLNKRPKNNLQVPEGPVKNGRWKCASCGKQFSKIYPINALKYYCKKCWDKHIK